MQIEYHLRFESRQTYFLHNYQGAAFLNPFVSRVNCFLLFCSPSLLNVEKFLCISVQRRILTSTSAVKLGLASAVSYYVTCWLHSWSIFSEKSWNAIILSSNLFLVRISGPMLYPKTYTCLVRADFYFHLDWKWLNASWRPSELALACQFLLRKRKRTGHSFIPTSLLSSSIPDNPPAPLSWLSFPGTPEGTIRQLASGGRS